MLYFANPCTPRVVAVMRDGLLGYIDTPRQGNRRPDDMTWCADNGCFSDKFNEPKWWSWLMANADQAKSCWFAVAPDVVGDAAATLVRSLPWLPRIRALGYPAAFVAQDGLEELATPWDEFDVLFIGGTTEWKLSHHVRELVIEAKANNKLVHMGRVNSRRRIRYAHSIGCNSVDGTFLAFGPDVNLPKILRWMGEVNEKGKGL